MEEPRATLVLELWEDSDGCSSICEAGPNGESTRALLNPRARLAWVFEATSHFDAMTQYHARMEWAPYSTEQPWELEPYPNDLIARQSAALAAELGDRSVVGSSRMAKAWREAATDLDIRFESPFALQHGGVTYWCAGWLPDFGGPQGTIIACRHALEDVLDAANAVGFYCSGLSPYYYETYDRQTFCDTLNDWGWFGERDAAPSWFTGGQYRHGGRD